MCGIVIYLWLTCGGVPHIISQVPYCPRACLWSLTASVNAGVLTVQFSGRPVGGREEMGKSWETRYHPFSIHENTQQTEKCLSNWVLDNVFVVQNKGCSAALSQQFLQHQQKPFPSHLSHSVGQSGSLILVSGIFSHGSWSVSSLKTGSSWFVEGQIHMVAMVTAPVDRTIETAQKALGHMRAFFRKFVLIL